MINRIDPPVQSSSFTRATIYMPRENATGQLDSSRPLRSKSVCLPVGRSNAHEESTSTTHAETRPSGGSMVLPRLNISSAIAPATILQKTPFACKSQEKSPFAQDATLTPRPLKLTQAVPSKPSEQTSSGLHLPLPSPRTARFAWLTSTPFTSAPKAPIDATSERGCTSQILTKYELYLKQASNQAVESTNQAVEATKIKLQRSLDRVFGPDCRGSMEKELHLESEEIGVPPVPPMHPSICSPRVMEKPINARPDLICESERMLSPVSIPHEATAIKPPTSNLVLSQVPPVNRSCTQRHPSNIRWTGSARIGQPGS